jgi:hypothetical protein
MSEESKEKAYIAICPQCKRVVGACTATMPDRDRAKSVANWMRAGLSIERATNEEVRTMDWMHAADCEMRKAARKGQKAKS